MSTRAQIRTNIRANLADAGITYYSEAEINTSIDDAYNKIVTKSKCLVKNTGNLNWNDNGVSNYFDFVTTYSVTDYLGATAIYNNQTGAWLRDDLSLRDFDRIRRDWELWRGTPQYWCPHSLKYAAVCPINSPGVGTFIVRYWALPAALAADGDTPVIAADMHDLIEEFSTADLLETAEEFAKAAGWWGQYHPRVESYRQRCEALAKSDLLMRV